VKLHCLVVAALLALASAGSAAAGPMEDAAAAYERGDYATAIRLLRVLAEQGDCGAQVQLGVMYQNGEGVRQNPAEATKWFRIAAEQGDPRAQLNIGITY
jgi:TPR repeat protein